MNRSRQRIRSANAIAAQRPLGVDGREEAADLLSDINTLPLVELLARAGEPHLDFPLDAASMDVSADDRLVGAERDGIA